MMRNNRSLMAVAAGLACSTWIAAQPACAQEKHAPRRERPAANAPWQPVARVEGNALREASGVVASRRRPGYFWSHGDSGNEPKLVAFDAAGKVVAEVIVQGAPNIDWEDIAADDAGHIFIGDFGNNLGMFPVRFVYRIDEPDPLAPPAAPVEVQAHWRFKYPPNTPRLNFESLAWRAGRLYLLGRELTAQTTLFALVPGANDNAALEPAATLNVTAAAGADFDSNGARLAVCSNAALWVFPIKEQDGKLALQPPSVVRYPLTGGIEACAFAADGVLLIDEGGRIYRISDAQIQAQVTFVRPAQKPAGAGGR